MSRSTLSAIAAVAALTATLGAWGCGGSSSTPTDPNPITYPQTTETYSGTIAPGEAKPFHFTITNPGSLTATITALAPVSTLTMGLTLGGWDATTETCPKVVYNDASRLNLVVSGTPQSAGEYCVAIYDVGNLQAPADFTLSVVHY